MMDVDKVLKQQLRNRLLTCVFFVKLYANKLSTVMNAEQRASITLH